MQLSIDYFRQQVGNQLSRVEASPRFFVEIQAWNDKAVSYNYFFYPETEGGKRFNAFFKYKTYDSPTALIAALKTAIDSFFTCTQDEVVLTSEPAAQ